MGVGFAKEEVLQSEAGGTKTLTVYAGYAPSEDASDSDIGWIIQKTITVIGENRVETTEKWGDGSWTDRASLTYKYK